MAVKFRKEAVKFLQKLSPDDVMRVRDSLNQLLIAVEEKRALSFGDLDIKTMKGDWSGFYRLRLGKIRIIFALNANDIEVYTIGNRGDVYK